MYTITKLKEDIEAVSHGTNLNSIENFNALVNRSARTVLAEVDPYETKREQQITNAIYDQVYLYSVPTDLKGDKILDIRRQVNRPQGEKFLRQYDEDFDREKYLGTFNIQSNSGVKTIRISASLTPGKNLHTMSSITDNGTWAVGGDATNLTKDTLNYVSNGASMNFDVDGSGTTGYIENSTMDSIDLSDDEDKSAMFLWLYVPDSSAFTSVNLIWGSDSSNYWSVTATTAQNSTAFVTGWNLVRFDWNGATETGSPDSSAVDYLKVTVTYDGTADTDFRVDNIMSKVGTIYSAVYYSKYIFQTSAGVWIEETTDDDDVINLETDSYNLLFTKCAENASQQTKGKESPDTQGFKDDYEKAKKSYNDSYKSEAKKAQSTYYSF